MINLNQSIFKLVLMAFTKFILTYELFCYQDTVLSNNVLAKNFLNILLCKIRISHKSWGCKVLCVFQHTIYICYKQIATI